MFIARQLVLPILAVAGLLGNFLAPASVAAAPIGQESTPVYAMPGTLQAALGQPYATFFVDRQGFFYALVGESVEVEEQIDALLAQGADVKVWGTLFPDGRATTLPEIVASAIQASDETPTASDQAFVVVDRGRINVRSMPDVNAPPVGQLVAGDRCPIIEQTADSHWYRVSCEGELSGWVSHQLVMLEGDAETVTLAPTPTPVLLSTPTPSTFVNWQTAYFNNRDLAGTPVATADLPEVNLNWGAGSPHPNVPPDNFSMRLERTIDFPAGNYRFLARADDGVRVYVNGQAIIYDWQEGGARNLRADQYLAGPAQILIEYFDAAGLAELQFGFEQIRIGEWEVNYFDNSTLSGNPVYINVEPSGSSIQLDRNWGEASPYQDRVGRDFWSGSWEGTFFLAAGNYDFLMRSDDGIRAYLDGQLILDNWVDGYKEETRRLSAVGEGYHDVRVEFYEKTGTALVMLGWQRVANDNIQ
jgi:uncharacterized protein YraI